MLKKTMRKWRNLPTGIKASVVFFLSSIVSRGLSYITTPLYTRLLTTEEFGLVSIYNTWKDVFGIIAMFSLSMGVFNNGMVTYPDRRDAYSRSMLKLSNAITLVSFLVISVLYPLIYKIIGLPYPMIILMFTVFLFKPAYDFWLARQRYELKYKAPLFWSSLLALIMPIGAIVLMLFNKYGDRFYPRIIGMELCGIGVFIYFHFYLRKNGSKDDKKYWKEAFLFNLPLIPHYLSTYLLNSSDRIMISALVGNAETAYYSVAYSVASIATMIWSSTSGTLIPYTYEKCKSEDYKTISRVTISILMIFACGCSLVILFAPEVIALMAPQEYRQAMYVIPPIVGGVFFQILYHVFANIIYYYKKPKYVMFGSVAATLLNIALNYMFIPTFGFLAAGYTTLVCFMVQAGIDWVALRKTVHKNVFDMKPMMLLSTIVFVVSLTSNALYNWGHIRFAIIALVFVLLIVFRQRIIKMIRIRD